jgi:tetrapyrrole methylase family protein / MazG family protein
MFALIKVAKFLRVNPDDALQATSDRFSRRFHSLEDRLTKSGRKMHEVKPEILYSMWRKGRNH